MTGEGRTQLTPARARSRVPVYIHEPPNEWHAGLLREHVLDPDGISGDDATLCGITYMSLPDNFPPTVESDGSLSYDKPWYYDHDVVVTFDCRFCFRLYEEVTHATD